MIKFFRKIRQKMLTENKFSKYLIYAIGEILLVMIGILLALQANQWKESKAELVLETKLLKEIQTGLKSDLIDVKVNYNWHKNILKNQNKIINWLQSDLKSYDSLTYEFSMATKISTFEVSTAPFESLKEFGLNRVSNDSLKNKIIRLYDVLYPSYRRAVEKYYVEDDRLFETGINYFDEWNQFPNIFTNKPKNITQLKADHTFLMRFKKSTNLNAYLVYKNSQISALLNEIIDSIVIELRNKAI
jgi:hypothetical protein